MLAPETLRLVVAEAEAGLRLDAFLARRQVVPSAAAARRWLAEGRVRVGGDRKPARKGERLSAGQEVLVLPMDALAPAGRTERDTETELPPLVVLHVDAALVAMDKPAGIASHPLRPGERGTAVDALLARYPECAAASIDPREGGLVHRLDVGTSGVMVAARDRQSWQRLRATFGGAGSEKWYLAEVVGAVSEGQAGAPLVVDAPIGRVGRRGGQVRIGGGRAPMSARTEIRVRERRGGSTTLVEAWLERGRPHQVRAHLAHLGFPVVGDPLYGAAPVGEGARLQLHAWRVRFPHPGSGAPLEIVAPPPDWARGQH